MTGHGVEHGVELRSGGLVLASCRSRTAPSESPVIKVSETSKPLLGPFHCDIVSHLAAKPRVLRREHLFMEGSSGKTGLRMMTVGLDSATLKGAF